MSKTKDEKSIEKLVNGIYKLKPYNDRATFVSLSSLILAELHKLLWFDRTKKGEHKKLLLALLKSLNDAGDGSFITEVNNKFKEVVFYVE